jgi:CRP-like cAMP-binding protein
MLARSREEGRMQECLRAAELFGGLDAAKLGRLGAIGRKRTLESGDYLFLLGDSAQYVSLVVRGLVDLCLPITIGGVLKDITVEAVGPGKTIGWSALVQPFRFTLSARAAAPTEILAFGRLDLEQVFATDPAIERVIRMGISELMVRRLTMFQALWARELQRALDPGRQAESA